MATLIQRYYTLGTPITLSRPSDNSTEKIKVYRITDTGMLDSAYDLGVPEEYTEKICDIDAAVINGEFVIDLHDIIESYVSPSVYGPTYKYDVNPVVQYSTEDYFGNGTPYIDDGYLMYVSSSNRFVLCGVFSIVVESQPDYTYIYHVTYNTSRYADYYGYSYQGFVNYPIQNFVYLDDVIPFSILTRSIKTDQSTVQLQPRVTVDIDVPASLAFEDMEISYPYYAIDYEYDRNGNTVSLNTTIDDTISEGNAVGFIQINEFKIKDNTTGKYYTPNSVHISASFNLDGVSYPYAGVNYKVLSCKPENTYTLYYWNQDGGLDFIYFNCKNTRKITKTGNTMVSSAKTRDFYIDPYKFGTKNISSSTKFEYTLNTDWLLNDFDISTFHTLQDRLTGLIQSDRVWLYDANNGMRAVNINDNALDLKQNSVETELFNLTLTVTDSAAHQTKQF